MPAGEEIIGTEIGVTTFPIDRSKIAELAAAVKDSDPTYARDRIAMAKDEEVPAPLNWSVLAAHWINPMAMMKALKLDLGRVLHGGSEWEYLAPLTAVTR